MPRLTKKEIDEWDPASKINKILKAKKIKEVELLDALISGFIYLDTQCPATSETFPYIYDYTRHLIVMKERLKGRINQTGSFGELKNRFAN